MTDHPVIAIIIPIHNRLKLTIQGLSYVKAAIDYYCQSGKNAYAIKLIIVDDGSTDGSGDWIRANYPDAIVLTGDGNLWWTGSVNKGIDYFQKNFASRRGVILQNDDIVVEKEWLLNLIECASVNPRAVIGCATSVLEDKSRIYYGGIAVHSWLSRTKWKNKGALRESFSKAHVEESFDLYGRGLFIPMDVLEKTGLFNQKRFRHRGDMDIPLRAKKLGYKLLVSYDAVVYQMPEYTFGLDSKKSITLKEALRTLTDFRSSTNIALNFYYSLQATKSWIQFVVFFCFRTLFAVKTVMERYTQSAKKSKSFRTISAPMQDQLFN